MNHRIRKCLVARGHALAPSEDELCATEEARAAEEAKTFFDWFQQDVLGLDSEEYRREFWREAYRTGHSIGHKPRTFEDWQRERGVRPSERLGDMLMIYLVVGGPSLAFWFIRRLVRHHLNRVRRPCYYPAERARRHALAQERRRQCRRTTTNPRPSLDSVRALFTQIRGNPEAALRLGGMLEDLECYLDNRPRFVGDRCIGRAGGIKRHLQKHAPDLFEHYSALMRYKAIAKRFRQAAGVSDPIPADALLFAVAEAGTAHANGGVLSVSDGRTALAADGSTVQAVNGRAAPAAEKNVAQTVLSGAAPAKGSVVWALEREKAAEILAEGAGTVVALEAALALRLDPDCIPAMADPAAVRTERTAPRILDWLRRRRSA